MRKFGINYDRRLRFIAFSILGFIAVLMVIFTPALLFGGAYALATIVPIWGLVSDKTFKEMKPEEVAKLEAAEQIKYFNELNLHKAQQMVDLKAQLKKEATEELTKQLDALRIEINKDNLAQMKLVQKALEDQGLALRKLTLEGGPAGRETLAKYLEENKAQLVGLVKGDGAAKALVIKANTVRASVTDSAEQFNIQDIGQLATRKLTFYELFNRVPVGPGSGGVVTYYDWDEATTVRAAKVIAEGGSYSESTAKWKWYSLPLVKVGDILPVSLEFEMDMPRFARELALFLQINVDIIVDDQLYDGSGTGSNMTGVYTAATAYVAVAQGITDASVYDLIVDARALITSGKRSKYNPDFVAMSLTDIKKYKLKKDKNNNYVMPPFVSADGSVIDGLRVIETSAVTGNTMLVGDSRYATIFEVEGYTLERGFQSGDWELDIPSLKARRRLNIVVKNADAGAFRKITDVNAALVTLAS